MFPSIGYRRSDNVILAQGSSCPESLDCRSSNRKKLSPASRRSHEVLPARSSEQLGNFGIGPLQYTAIGLIPLKLSVNLRASFCSCRCHSFLLPVSRRLPLSLSPPSHALSLYSISRSSNTNCQRFSVLKIYNNSS